MTALAVVGRAIAAIVVAAAITAGFVLVLCLAVVYAGPLIDALTGGFTP